MSLRKEDILRQYEDAGFSFVALRNKLGMNQSEFDNLIIQIPELAVHRRAPKHSDHVFAKYSSDGGYIHADHTFYAQEDVSVENDGYSVILVVVDVLTRMAFARPLKSKSGHETAQALEEIFEEYRRMFGVRPKRMQTDRAQEFMGREVARVLTKFNTSLVHGNNQKIGAPVAEAFNKTLRATINKWFTFSKSLEWYTKLERFISDYNYRPHSTLRVTSDEGWKTTKKISPMEAVQLVHDRESWRLPTSSFKVGRMESPKLAIGTPVRVRVQDVDVGHKQFNWSDQIYLIRQVRAEQSLSGVQVDLYMVEDLNSQYIPANGYEVSSETKFRFSDLLPVPLPARGDASAKKIKDPRQKAESEVIAAIDKVIKSVESMIAKQKSPDNLKGKNLQELQSFLELGLQPVGQVVVTRQKNIEDGLEMKTQLQQARANAKNNPDIIEIRREQKSALLRVPSEKQRQAMDKELRRNQQDNKGRNVSSKRKVVEALKAKVVAAITGLDI